MNPEIDLLCDALNNSRGPDQRRIAEVGLQVVTTLLKKNADYGGSAWQAPVLCPHLPPRTGILVRLSDKIRRFGNLLAKGKGEVDDEPLDATMLDFAGYSILYLAYPGDSDEVSPVRLDQPRTDCDAGCCDCC